VNLLHIDSSALGANSASRALSAATVAKLKATHPHLKVTTLDLAAQPLAHLSGAHLMVRMGMGEPPADLAHDVAAGDAALEDLIAADIIVVGAPVYNFSIPSTLKAWIDRVCVAGKTFRYTEHGPQGLLSGKRVILAISRGGVYAPDTPMAAFEHAESYLRIVFGFLGVTDLEVIVAEGLAVSEEQKTAALAQAHEKIAALA
jgi:FMN-dependent NADH-azoreductase